MTKTTDTKERMEPYTERIIREVTLIIETSEPPLGPEDCVIE